jgi:hypothetical protein
MGVWKTGCALRIRGDLKAEMEEFAKSEKRSFGNLGAVLLDWSFELLKAAGSTSELFGRRSVKRLNNINRDRRKRGAGGLRWVNGKHK